MWVVEYRRVVLRGFENVNGWGLRSEWMVSTEVR